MTLAHARSLLAAEPLVQEHAPADDRGGLERLAVWATRFSPSVMVDGNDHGLLIDITGCAHLYQGERPLVTQLLKGVASLGLSASAAVAPSCGAAWALARYQQGKAAIVDHLSALPEALAPLPVSALRVDEPTVDALAEVGVRRVGQLLDLPRHELPSRFSDDLMLRIDQALGRAMEPITPIRSSTLPCVQRTFAGPVKKLEAIQQATRQLLDQLCTQLLEREAGLNRLRLTLDRSDCEPIHLTLRVSRPTRDARHLWRLLQPKLETAHLGFGVETISIEATHIAPLPHRQQVDAALHEHAATSISFHAAHGQLLDTLPAPSSSPPASPGRAFPSLDTAPAPSTAARPTQLFDRAEPVQVQSLTHDGPVLQINWHGRLHHVVRSVGPERLTNAWWRGPTSSRDYFRVQLESGLHLWVYHEMPSGLWFVHGWWV